MKKILIGILVGIMLFANVAIAKVKPMEYKVIVVPASVQVIEKAHNEVGAEGWKLINTQITVTDNPNAKGEDDKQILIYIIVLIREAQKK